MFLKIALQRPVLTTSLLWRSVVFLSKGINSINRWLQPPENQKHPSNERYNHSKFYTQISFLLPPCGLRWACKLQSLFIYIRVPELKLLRRDLQSPTIRSREEWKLLPLIQSTKTKASDWKMTSREIKILCQLHCPLYSLQFFRGRVYETNHSFVGRQRYFTRRVLDNTSKGNHYILKIANIWLD